MTMRVEVLLANEHPVVRIGLRSLVGATHDLAVSGEAADGHAVLEMVRRRLDPERVRYWEVFANVRWAIIALQQSDRYLIGGARDLSTAPKAR